MERAKPQHEPVEQSVHVDCTPAEAFELFTGRFAEWWPAVEDRKLQLGTILEWDPPNRVKFAWPSFTPGGQEQTVDVRFIEDAGGTRVNITHEGWQRAAAPACAARFAGFVREELLVMA